MLCYWIGPKKVKVSFETSIYHHWLIMIVKSSDTDSVLLDMWNYNSKVEDKLFSNQTKHQPELRPVEPRSCISYNTTPDDTYNTTYNTCQCVSCQWVIWHNKLVISNYLHCLMPTRYVFHSFSGKKIPNWVNVNRSAEKTNKMELIMNLYGATSQIY